MWRSLAFVLLGLIVLWLLAHYDLLPAYEEDPHATFGCVVGR
jgi:hypothetical protein